jgi:hypothetical protein
MSFLSQQFFKNIILLHSTEGTGMHNYKEHMIEHFRTANEIEV